MNNVQFLTGTLAQYQALTPVSSTFYYITDTKALYLGDLLLSNSGEVAAAVVRIAKNEGDIVAINEVLTKIQGDASVEGSVKNLIKAAQDELQGKIDAIDTKVGSLENLDTTDKDNIVDAINEVRRSVSSGGTAAVVTLSESSSEDYAKIYTLKQGDNTVGTINIPKDMVVQSGTVEVNPEGQPEGTYMVLTLANATNDKLYINVGSLVDIYTVEAKAAQVQLAIDPATRAISATIVAGSIGTAELADNAIVTAKIADGNVTKAKLSVEVQESLAKADAAAGLVSEALTTAKGYADELNTAMDSRVDSLEAAVGETGSISAAIEAAENRAKGYADSLAKNYDKSGAAAQALVDAKAYADGLAKNYATAEQGAKADTAVQTIVTGSTNGTISVDGTEVAVKGLGGAAFKAENYYEVAGSANSASAAALEEAKAYTDTALAWASIDGGNVSE